MVVTQASDYDLVGELLDGAPTEGQFLNQGYLQMAQAQNFATAAALTKLGYHVSATNSGALVYGIPNKSPAAGTLKVAEVAPCATT